MQKVVFDATDSAHYKQVAINAAGSGDNTLVSALALGTVRVAKLFLVVNGAVNIQFWDGPSVSGTAFTGLMDLPSGGSLVLDLDGEPWFITTAGNPLVMNLSGAVQVSGRLYYSQSITIP